MIPIVLFGLWCLGPLTVMGMKRSWLPATVPWPAEQCVNVGRGFVGECTMDPNPSREGLFYSDNPTCEKLKCAVPRSDGGYSLIKLGPPLDGTFCGILQVCRNGDCVDIDADEIPTATGIKTTYKCDPPIVVRKPMIDRDIIKKRKKTKAKAPPRKREISTMASSGSDTVDPVTGLSMREIDILRTTWALLTKDIVASGVDIMLSLIDAYPEYKSLFVSFKDIPRADLPGNKKFQAHGVNVAKAINTMIVNLTNADLLVSHLEGLGSRHTKRGVTKKTVNTITAVMVGVLRRNVGKDFTKEVEDIWVKTMNKAWSIMFPTPAQDS